MNLYRRSESTGELARWMAKVTSVPAKTGGLARHISDQVHFAS